LPSTSEVTTVRDIGLGFMQTILFVLIVVIVLGGVMLLVNYLAAPGFGGVY
jgi:hypothetical protein